MSKKNAALTAAVEVPKGYRLISEGSANMIFNEKNEVFYNKVQVLNRDLSTTMIQEFAAMNARRIREKESKKKGWAEAVARGENPQKIDFTEYIANDLKDVDYDELVKTDKDKYGLRVLDALAASGLRSIRYYKEIEGVKEVVVNDMSPEAVEQAHENVKFNNVDPNVVRVQEGDAIDYMYSLRGKRDKQFDVIDLDPYGSVVPFVDSAVQAVKDGGFLNVTSTDMSVLSGGQSPEACFAKYRSFPQPHASYLHEFALRILLHTLETSANRYGRTIVPLASFGIDFYCRIFVRVFDSRAEAKKACLKTGNVLQSTGCPSFHILPSADMSNSGKSYVPSTVTLGACEETGKPFKINGPIWIAPIHDFDTVDAALKRVNREEKRYPLGTQKRLHGLLTSVSEELSDCPLYYKLDELASTLRVTVPKLNEFKSAIMNAGYRVSSQHKEPMAIKTDAPNSVIWDILRCHEKLHPVADKRKMNKKERLKLRKEENKKSAGEEAKEGIENTVGEDATNPPHLTAGQSILSKEPKILADFTVPKDSVLRRRVKASRYPPNPEKNWGPMERAKGKRKSTDSGENVTGDSKKARANANNNA